MINVIGGGPAGLMAAETLARAGKVVSLYEKMPTAGRKFLMAGRGGLNLTHSEPLEKMLQRYGSSRDRLGLLIERFPPDALRAWAADLGQETFIGSSGRIFPASLKTSPLLRLWMAKLASLGVRIMTRHEWIGWDDRSRPVFRKSDSSTVAVCAHATILALGGASWPRLGSDGNWVETLARHGVTISPLRPTNCGFDIKWSDMFRNRFQGQPMKNISVRVGEQLIRGEAMVTASGIEGGAIYAVSKPLREAIEAGQKAVMTIDLSPDIAFDILVDRLRAPRRGQSLSNFLRKQAGLAPIGINLLREAANITTLDAGETAALIKAVPLTAIAAQPLKRAISTAGGIRWDALDEHLMLRDMPGVFAAGEMLDWEAPTGGYLLQACFSTGVAAANGVLAWLHQQ